MTQHFSWLAEPLVEKNLFRQQGPSALRLPKFEELRPCLPIPVLPQNTAWEAVYWRAWEALWKSQLDQSSGSTHPGGNVVPGIDRTVSMGQSAFLTNLSGYIPGSFKFVELLDRFYAAQHETGFIHRDVTFGTSEAYAQAFDPNSTGPNLLAWSAWRAFRLTGDKNRIAAVFPALMAHHRWCRDNRTWRNGLYWTTGYASELINQPRVPNGRYHHRHWAWIDACSQAVLNCTMLERMALLLEEAEMATEVATEQDRLIRVINSVMWNGELNFYQDVGPDGVFSPLKSIAAYWALLDAKLIPKDRLSPFIQHLRDTWSFRTEFVLPTLSADSDAYNARTGNGWRGAVWPHLTYMVQRGLNVAQHFPLAHKLALNHVDMVSRVHTSTDKFWENYMSEDLGPAEPMTEDVSGLTPAAIIPMVLEFVLGFSVDWPLRQIIWRRSLSPEQVYGVRNLPLGNEGTIDLLSDEDTIQIRTDAPITLIIHDNKEIFQTAVPAGEFALSLK